MPDLRFVDRVKRLLVHITLRIPVGWRRLLIGRPPVNDRGVALDEDVHWLLGLERLVRGGLSGRTPEAARAGLETGVRAVEPAPAPVARCEDLDLDGLTARLYAPASRRPPVLVFFHGGGWVAGSLRSHDRLCRRLCAQGDWMVISVDYRLAPEHPFPAGRDDAVAAFRAVRERAASLGGDPERVALGGDSAGGNLSASACLALRDAGEALPFALFQIYPAVDLRRGHPSHRLFAEGYLLTAAQIDYYVAQYGGDAEDPAVSPLLAADLSGLPPTVVVTAGFDPLRDEGEAWVEALREAGVPVRHVQAPSMVHGFANMDGALIGADRTMARVVTALRATAAGDGSFTTTLRTVVVRSD